MIGVNLAAKPREVHLVFRDLHRQGVGVQRLAEQCKLACHQRVQAVQTAGVETVQRKAYFSFSVGLSFAVTRLLFFAMSQSRTMRSV